MADSESVSMQSGVTVWQKGGVRCTCTHVAHDRIEIVVTIDGKVAHDGWFADHLEASQFAIDAMNHYQAT